MGTIAEKLSYLAYTKDLFKDRLNSLGAEIIESTTFRNYLSWLDTFYNQSSDKTDLAKNGVVGKTIQNTAILPSEYTQVDYIESSGTQYIDTGHYPSSNNDELEIQTSYVGGNTTSCLFGAYANGSFYQLNKTTTANQFRIITRTGDVFYTFEDYASKHTYLLESNKLYIDNTEVATGSGTVDFSSQTLYLFARNYSGEAGQFGSWRIYSCKIKTNDILVQDFIPCYRNSDNEVGLYDIVNDVFYTNQGTGVFTYGSVVSIPNPDYPQEINNLSGDVEYKVSGKNLLTTENATLNKYLDTSGNLQDSSVSGVSDYIDVSKLSNVYLNYTGLNTGIKIYCYYDENKAFKTYGSYTTSGKSIDVSNYSYLRITYVMEENNTIMLNEGTTATPYEPYISESFPLSLGDIELCKIDTYEDKIARSKGKNLFDKSNIIENTYISNKGGTGSSQVSNLSDYIEVKPNTSYTLSYDYSALLNSTQRGIVYYDENRIYISGVEYRPENKTHTITTPNSTKYIRFSYDKSCYSIMLNEGNTALPYEPYGKVWYLNKQIGKVILNGSETSWSYYSTGQYFYKTWNYPRGSAKMFIQFISNRYKNYQQQIVTSDNNKMVLVQQPDRNSEINISNHDYTTTSDFKTWLSTHNTIVYYPLATPTTTEITEENYPTLYSQLLAIQEFLTKYKINKEFLLDYSSPEIEY